MHMPPPALLGLGLCFVGPLDAQESPDAATLAFLEYADTAYGGAEPLLIESDSFLGSEAVVAMAKELGLAHGPRAELVECSDDRRSCRILPDGRLLRITAQTPGADSREWRFRIYLASDVATPDGRSRIFGVAREVRLVLNDGWRVVDDVVLFRTE